jgi:serine/threonine protein kinase
MIIKIDKYYVNENECLGKGAFSTVYKGTLISNNLMVAVKKITRENMNIKMIERLNDEILIMNLIKKNPHPNIIKCYDIYDNVVNVYIMMEYCDSGDLSSIMQEPIREVWVQYYMCQLVNGLKYLNSNNIFHRDIKPKNILLTKNSKILKIADFGLARILNSNSIINTLCGSPLYMSPEILHKKSHSTKSDLWSIGIVIYEMLFGRHPFTKCNTIAELFHYMTIENIIIPPNNDINEISKSCVELLISLLKKNPNDRITWNDFFSHPWLNRFKFINLDNEPIRVNSNSSINTLSKTNYEDNKLEHSQYSSSNIDESFNNESFNNESFNNSIGLEL